jgi:hypothetical protein
MSRATELVKRLELLAATGLATTEDQEAVTLLRDQEKALKLCVEALERAKWCMEGYGYQAMEGTIAHTSAAVTAAEECLK